MKSRVFGKRVNEKYECNEPLKLEYLEDFLSKSFNFGLISFVYIMLKVDNCKDLRVAQRKVCVLTNFSLHISGGATSSGALKDKVCTVPVVFLGRLTHFRRERGNSVSFL